MCSTLNMYMRRVIAVGATQGITKGKAIGLQEGKMIGLQEGEKRGEARGITKGETRGRYMNAYRTVENVRKSLRCSLEKALEITGITKIEYMNGKRLSEI